MGYFQLDRASDVIVFYKDVNYINGGWINRDRILINNKEQVFTIPLIKDSQYSRLIKDDE